MVTDKNVKLGQLDGVELTLESIIELTGACHLSGTSDHAFTGIAALGDAGPCDVSFLGNSKYVSDFKSTRAGLVFVPEGVEDGPAGAVLLQAKNPSYAFGEIVNLLARRRGVGKPGIHARAYVAEGVELDPATVSIAAGAVIETGVSIGAGSEIGPGVVIGEGVRIGKDCLIHANVTVREFCVLGDRVVLQPGCVVGSDGYGYELINGQHVKIDQVGNVELGNDVEIGANTTIDRARFGTTFIDEGAKIDNLVQIAHNVQIGKHSLIVAQSGIAGSAQLGNYVTIAAQAGVAGHVKVGDQAVLLGRGGITKDLEGKQVYMGMPARPAKEEQKKLAALARLPKLIAEFKELKKTLQ